MGLMLVPVFLRDSSASPEAYAHGTCADHATMTGSVTVLGDLVAAGIHALAIFAVMGAVAVLVYEKLGVAILKRTWFNVDLLWSGALVGTGVITLVVYGGMWKEAGDVGPRRQRARSRQQSGKEISMYVVRLGDLELPKVGYQDDPTAQVNGTFPFSVATGNQSTAAVYTPVHGPWLNKVEVEISVLVRQCLKGRLPDKETLEREAQAWCRERNRLGAGVDWRFRTEDARIKLLSLYPSVKV